MKVATALVLVALLILPAAAWSQDAPIKIYIAPLLSTLDHRTWFGIRDSGLADAVRAAFSQGPFQIVPRQSANVLALAAPDGVKKKNEQYIFTVVFLQDDIKLGEAVEYCPINKLTDCTDQLVLDTKTAAK